MSLPGCGHLWTLTTQVRKLAVLAGERTNWEAVGLGCPRCTWKTCLLQKKPGPGPETLGLLSRTSE
jgi:hypothetical protein